MGIQIVFGSSNFFRFFVCVGAWKSVSANVLAGLSHPDVFNQVWKTQEMVYNGRDAWIKITTIPAGLYLVFTCVPTVITSQRMLLVESFQ